MAIKITLLVVALVAVALILTQFVGNSKTTVATDTTVTTAQPTTSVSPVSSVPKTPVPAVYGVGACPAADGSSPVTKTFTQAPKQCIDLKKKYTAKLDTSEGEIDIALNVRDTPVTANNFVALALYHYYDGTVIFRTDTALDIIQGGGMTAGDQLGYTIPDEGANWQYTTGDIAMANTGRPNTGGAEWFIATGPKVAVLNTQGSYTKFGTISVGLDVAQKIIGLNKEIAGSNLGGAPSRTVTIKTVTIVVS